MERKSEGTFKGRRQKAEGRSEEGILVNAYPFHVCYFINDLILFASLLLTSAFCLLTSKSSGLGAHDG
jgi:hypothetical protein